MPDRPVSQRESELLAAIRDLLKIADHLYNGGSLNSEYPEGYAKAWAAAEKLVAEDDDA